MATMTETDVLRLQDQGFTQKLETWGGPQSGALRYTEERTATLTAQGWEVRRQDMEADGMPGYRLWARRQS